MLTAFNSLITKAKYLLHSTETRKFVGLGAVAQRIANLDVAATRDQPNVHRVYTSVNKKF